MSCNAPMSCKAGVSSIGRRGRGRGARRPLGPVATAVLAFLLLAPAGLPAQDAADGAAAQDASTPEAATMSLVHAIRSADYAGMAELMHPAALAELKELFLPILEAPEMAGFRQEAFGTASAEEAAALSGAEIYRRIISLALQSDPGTAAIMETVRADVIGHVMEGDTAHVVYRMDMDVEGIALSQTAVASFTRADGRWLGLLSADIRGMIAGLRQALEDTESGE